MGKRIGIETYEELISEGNLAFINGVIQGRPLAKIANDIIFMATAFGGDLAERENNFFASYRGDNMDELKRDATRVALECLVGGKGIEVAVERISTMATAFGFRAIKATLPKA